MKNTVNSILKKAVFALIMVVITLGVHAQQTKWESGGLAWEHFKGMPTKSSAQSYLYYYIGFKSAKTSMNDTILRRYQVYSYSDATLSWVKPAGRTAAQLKYNQVIFDIVESYKRKIQKAVDKAASPDELKSQFASLGQECKQTVDLFSELSGFGTNAEMVENWRKTKSVELQGDQSNSIAAFSKSKIGYGLHAGLGYGITTSSLTDYIEGFPFVMGGAELAVGKPVVSLNGQFGVTDFLKEYKEGNAAVYANIKVAILMADVQIAYPLVNKRKHKLSPFAGFGFTLISNASGGGNRPEKRLKPFCLNPLGGLSYDYKFKRIVKLSFNQLLSDTKEYVEGSVRFKLFVARQNFSSEFKGNTINFSIGISGFGRKVETTD